MVKVSSVNEMRAIGAKIADQLKAGDLIILSGELGAGKTALTQGIGVGLGISEITSPTFVISRIHQGKLPLIHVDAYRLIQSPGVFLEFEDLDLPSKMSDAVTVIEWGSELAPLLKDEFLEIKINFISDNERNLEITPHGTRWQGFKL
ncbi:MAG: tRNA (adenosine(37)-N6)-threonylcarbamoyltransferase complex ATPase subunit type 1 TsaE [Candidatus Nanopelagicaceae bacterium]